MSHVSIVGAISLMGKISQLLILGKQNIDENNVDIVMRRHQFHYQLTKSGYANTKTAIFFIQNILYPYISNI